MIMKLFTTALILAAVNAKPEDPMTRKLKQRAGPKPAAGHISRHGEKPKHARVHGDKPEHGRAHGDKPEHARAHGDKPQRARAGDGGETPLKVARGEEPALDARGCYDEWIADGWCDLDNNNADCSLDGGDCCPTTCVDSTYTCGVVGYAPFDAGYGTCDTYAVGGSNQDYCYWDYDSCLGLYASSACVECSNCGEFDAGCGTCDTYAPGGVNEDWCLHTFDSCLDQYASDACDECLPTIVFRNAEDPGLCIDVETGFTDGTPVYSVQTWECNGTNAQRWSIDSFGRIRSAVVFNHCLEAGATGNLYDKLYISECHDELSQQWDFEENNKIYNKAYPSKVIGVAYGCGGVGIGVPVELHHDWYGGTCQIQQEWFF